jgi:aminoglycoside phosphotransferase (APT) family kinase protein
MSPATLSRIAPREQQIGWAARPVTLGDFVDASGLRSVVLGASKDPNAKVTVLLVSDAVGEPVLAVKVPTTDDAARAVLAEARVLDALGTLEDHLLETVPRGTDLVEFGGRPALVTTALQGVPMSTLYLRPRHTRSPARVAADFSAAARWLAAFQGATAHESTPLELAEEVESRLRARFSGDDSIEGNLARLREIDLRLRRNTVPRTAVHGDLWFGNLLVSDGRISGVVDWEEGALSGQPVRDLVRFANMYALYLDHRTREGRRVAGHRGMRAGPWGAGVAFALDGDGWFPELYRGFLAEGLARLGASPQSWRDAALAGLAEVAAFTDDPEFSRRHLELFRRVAYARGGEGGAA